MPRKPKVRPLSVLLLKEHVVNWEDALKDPVGLERYELSGALPFPGALYIRHPRDREPWWVEFVASGVDDELGHMRNTSTAAVLFVEHQHADAVSHVLAICFGYGRNLLKPEAYERDFGLKVVLNAVNPERLRSVDMRTVEELTVHTRRQASRGTPMETFGVDVSIDLLRAVTGEPRDGEFASCVTGADGLKIHTRIEFAELGTKCERILQEYESEVYKKDFGWIDHLRTVQSPDTKAELDNAMVDLLQAGQLDKLYLAPPEPLDWENLEGFTYASRRDTEQFAELAIEDFVAVVDDMSMITVDWLKRHQIGVVYAGQEYPLEQWSTYQCVVCEVKRQHELYVLSAGQWYQVDRDFAAGVDESLEILPLSGIQLPAAIEGEWEQDYNKRAAADVGLVLLDRVMVVPAQGETPIEACDMFTPERQFVHVKRRTFSATLSHLFAQGMVSAETFAYSRVFRENLRGELNQRTPDLSPLVPGDGPVNTGQFEVVYAIISDKDGAWPLCLPFFSRLHLRQSSERLIRMGYKVSTMRVEVHQQ